MFRLINLSAVIIAIGMPQISTLDDISLEELFYPIRLPGHPQYIPKKANKVITRNRNLINPKLTHLQTLLRNEKKKSSQISVFDSPISRTHAVGQEDKTTPLQGLTFNTVAADDDRANQNNELHQITVDSLIPSEHEEDQENEKIPVQSLSIDTDGDQVNENNDFKRISIVDSSIPRRNDENQNQRKVYIQGLTIDTIPGSNDQAYSKQELHRISVFDSSTQHKQEVEVSTEIPLQGLSIPIKDSNEINPEIDLHGESIFHSSSRQRNSQQEQKEDMEDEDEDEESGEEQNETEVKKGVEEQFNSKTTIRAPYQEGNRNKGLHRISVFDSNILSNDDDDDEIKIKDTTRPKTEQKYSRRISVFDSTHFYPESVPVTDQTLLGDISNQVNPEMGINSIPILNSSRMENNRKYKSYVMDKDIPPNIVKNSTGPQNTEKKNLKIKSHDKGLKNKKKTKKTGSKFVFDSPTVLEYGDNLAHIGDNWTVAQAMTRRVRVLCWVMTYPKNHFKKAWHVKKTWGRRCNTLLFMSTEKDKSLPTVKLDVIEDYKYLWGKTKAAFRYIHENYLNDADWFLKADDDTYVIVENLRYLLVHYNSNDPIYFGFRFKSSYCPKQGYTSGGAGYVLSRKALDRFVTKALPSPDLCKKDDTGAEDAEIGKCLERIGVMIMDSRDSYKRHRFFPFMPHDHIDVAVDPEYWYWKMAYYPIETGRGCCSEYAISFHYVDPPSMYALDYFVYHLRPYGISFNYEKIYNNKHH